MKVVLPRSLIPDIVAIPARRTPPSDTVKEEDAVPDTVTEEESTEITVKESAEAATKEADVESKGDVEKSAEAATKEADVESKEERSTEAATREDVVPESTAAASEESRDDLIVNMEQRLTLRQLREMCTERGLESTGKKAELVARLSASDRSN